MPSSKTGRGMSVRGQGRRLLLEAARELFATKRYVDVSTKEIADQAGVTEPILFRHFGTKNALFEEAVFEPFSEFLNAFIEDWETRPRGIRDALDECRDLYRGFYAVLADNRQLVRGLIAAEAMQPAGATNGGNAPPLGRILKRFEKLTVWERQIHGFRPFDPTILSHLIFGMVFSVAIHGDWMSAGVTGPTPNADAYIEEMAALTVYGLYDRPAHNADPTTR
jgi:AcrR family transcriptional regulator